MTRIRLIQTLVLGVALLPALGCSDSGDGKASADSAVAGRNDSTFDPNIGAGGGPTWQRMEPIDQ